MEEKSVECSIESFHNGEELLATFERKKYDLLFLDILMGELNGIDVGKRVRECDLDTEIIYCTSSKDFLMASYEVFALGYILKPFSMLQVGRLIDYFLYKNRITSTQFVAVKTGSVQRKIYFKEIIYVESMNKVVFFHTISNGEIRVYGKLNDFEKELDDRKFLRCHQSYIINMDYIARMSDNEFVTLTNSLIPIRRRERKLIRDKYYEYLNRRTEAEIFEEHLM
jgi:DNA-binding LytR/AlgR family response regulator